MNYKLAKITKSAIQKRIIAQYGETTQPTNAEMTEMMVRKFKKDIKREQLLETYNLHRYYMSKKEKRIAKARLSRMAKK